VDSSAAQQHPTPSPTTASDPSSPAAHPLKRKLHNLDDADEFPFDLSERADKRTKLQSRYDPAGDSLLSADQSPIERARDEIRHQFGLEILLKHDELRLINQELAKCQVALEQLRRCHLIPYPVNFPTPEQMLQVSSGNGPAIASQPGEPVPRWAAPFGVVDGPYARHYAKWLIPDPSFDGIQPEWQFTAEYAAARASLSEGRTTRNSFTETTAGPKGRPGRTTAGQRLQSLSSGYPQPKDKAGPCVLKRADGQTVKLVCIDCNRENFSSTQGFINHCRIAHKRDFKSHEEAAVQSGHPIEPADGSGSAVPDDKPPAPASTSTPVIVAPTTPSAFVHPFARQDVSDQQAYASLRSRIADAIKVYHQSEPSGTAVKRQAKKPKKKNNKFKPASDTPYLSQFMQNHKFNGDLGGVVSDAKTKTSLDDMSDEESEDVDNSLPSLKGSGEAPRVHTPVVMRMPARSSPAPMASSGRPVSSKGRPAHMDFVSPPTSTTEGSSSTPHVLSDDDADMEESNLSPNALVGNAPSLVSDDGEYDDSDEGSSTSEVSDSMEAGSVSDGAEIAVDDEHEPRALRRGSGAVRLRKSDSKHVTFMGPVKGKTKQRRSRRV
jgi:ADA HAT complex component 1